MWKMEPNWILEKSIQSLIVSLEIHGQYTCYQTKNNEHMLIQY